MQACGKGIRTASFVAAVLICVYLSAASAVEISVLSPPKEEAPGAIATHVFSVINDGPADDTYNLLFDAPAGWGILGTPDSITVNAGREETLFVTLTIPSGALADEYEIVLTAVSRSDPTESGTSTAAVVVSPMREIELVAPTGSGIVPGSHAEYEFVLINRGNLQDSFSVEAISSKRLAVTLSETIVALSPREQATIRVRVDIPIETSPGRDVLTVSAVSTLYEDSEAQAVVFTTILPPGPQDVNRTLMEILPLRARLSIDREVLPDNFSSRLTLSTSGQILGGFFSTSIGLSDPLGPDVLEVGSFSILYRRAPITYTIGDVSQQLTDLLRLSCRGGSVTVDEELFDLSMIGGGANDETRFAGYLTLGPEAANLGIAYRGIRDLTSMYEAVWSAMASARPFSDWTIRIEAALGIDGARSSRALLFGTEIDTPGLFFSGTAFSIGTHFPGSWTDSAGIELSYRFRLNALSLRMSAEHVWDNVIHDPLVDTLIRDDLGMNLTATPLADGPTFGTTIEFTWDRYPDTSVRSELDTLVAVNVTETSGVFPYVFSGKITDQIDHVLGTHVRRSTFSEGAGLSVDSLYLFLQLTQEKQIDVMSDLVLSSSSDVAFRFRPKGALHEASIVFRNTVDEFDLSASLQIEFVENLNLVFDGSIQWDRADADSISFGWGIAFNADFVIPIPFLVTKGQIEGRVFVDRDGDGLYGVLDQPVDGIIVVADGGEASTNPDGLFRFPPFYPETYTLTPTHLPIDAAAGEPIVVDLLRGRTVRVDIPLTPVATVGGRLFDDLDQDGIEDPGEGGFEKVRAFLSDEQGVISTAWTDSSGRFVFPAVAPGLYTVRLDMETVPDRLAFTTAEEATVDVSAGTTPSAVFGGYVRPRTVIITFQPPTADFLYMPEAPVAGEPITFDGTLSFDFDGQITAHAWDLNADGVPDATEPVIEHVFSEPGLYDVSLSVTDDAGNTDTIVLSIQVAVGEPLVIQPVSTSQPPIADFGYMPSPASVGESIRFDATPSSDPDGEIVSYAWDFDGDGTIDASEAIPSHVFASPGSYSVSLTVTDNNGSRDTLTVLIEVAPQPEPVIEPSVGLPIAGFQQSPTEPVSGEPVLFNGTPSLDPGGQIVGFAWDFDGDGQTDSTAPLAEHTFVEPGTYVVSLTVTDDEDNTNTISGDIQVTPAPVPTTEPASFQLPVADFAYMPASPSVGDPVLFNGTFSFDFDGEIVAFAWDFDGDGTIDATEGIPEYRYDTPGTYVVSLTVTDDGGNTDTIAISVDIK